MNDVKWIKITTDMFSNRKIRHLRKLPEGNNIVLIWVMLLTMAGRCNSGGMIFLTENIPYTAKMLADELDFEESTVLLAIQALESLDMITMDDKYFSIASWDEYQNFGGLEKIREQNRIRKQKQRERESLALTDSHVTSRDSHATDIEEDIEEDIERDKGYTLPDEPATPSPSRKTDYQSIINLYHEICKSFPKVQKVSENRKKAIKARMKSYTMEDFETLFRKAEASDFLKGKNDRDWSATFDWMIKDANMAKILDGNFDNRPGGSGKGNREAAQERIPRKNSFNDFEHREIDFDEIERRSQQQLYGATAGTQKCISAGYREHGT